MNVTELSMSETIIVAMALRVLMEQEISPKDREIAETIDRKLRISYRGKNYTEKKVRLIFSNE